MTEGSAIRLAKWPRGALVRLLGASLAILLAIWQQSSLSPVVLVLGGILLGLIALSDRQRLRAQQESLAAKAKCEAELNRLNTHIVSLRRESRLQQAALEHHVREALGAAHDSDERKFDIVRNPVVVPRAGFDNIFRQSEALLALYRIIDPPTPFPPTRGWAMSPDLLLHLVNLIRTERPRRVVECGSGVSTAVVALALKRFSGGKIIALEHAEWAGQRTQQLLEEWGISEFGEVRCAPLETREISGASFDWYSSTSLPDGPFDLVIIDGPPEGTGPLARYPAGELLLRQLTAPGWAILDDATRRDESTAAQRWTEEIPGLQSRAIDAEKGAVELFRDPE